MIRTLCGGYKTIITAQLANLVVAWFEKKINLVAIRCYLGLFALQASREAAKRDNVKQGRKSPPKQNFAVTELVALLGGVGAGEIRKALRQLEGAGLATARKGNISITETPTKEAREWLEKAGIPANRRIPFPRRMLCFLAKSRKRSLIFTVFAYTMRGLFLKKGTITNAGTCKRSWIEEHFKLSEGSVKSARAELLKLNFITPDQTEKQWKLNRDGAYFSVNTEWSYQQDTEKNRAGESSEAAKIAPLKPENDPLFAPPIEKQKTSYGNLETKKPENRASGFSKKISFRNIQPEQIRKMALLLVLYQSALKQGLFAHSERNLLNFFAAAAKAQRRNSKKENHWANPVRIFVWTVKNGFKYINDSDEKRAETRLKEYRRANPEAFEFLEPKREESPQNGKQREQQAKFQELISQLTAKNSVAA